MSKHNPLQTTFNQAVSLFPYELRRAGRRDGTFTRDETGRVWCMQPFTLVAGQVPCQQLDIPGLICLQTFEGADEIRAYFSYDDNDTDQVSWYCEALRPINFTYDLKRQTWRRDLYHPMTIAVPALDMTEQSGLAHRQERRFAARHAYTDFTNLSFQTTTTLQALFDQAIDTFPYPLHVGRGAHWRAPVRDGDWDWCQPVWFDAGHFLEETVYAIGELGLRVHRRGVLLDATLALATAHGEKFQNLFGLSQLKGVYDLEQQAWKPLFMGL